jgi:hypothetical protein
LLDQGGNASGQFFGGEVDQAVDLRGFPAADGNRRCILVRVDPQPAETPFAGQRGADDEVLGGIGEILREPVDLGAGEAFGLGR